MRWLIVGMMLLSACQPRDAYVAVALDGGIFLDGRARTLGDVEERFARMKGTGGRVFLDVEIQSPPPPGVLACGVGRNELPWAAHQVTELTLHHHLPLFLTDGSLRAP